jgi:integrase/recombinase XerD
MSDAASAIAAAYAVTPDTKADTAMSETNMYLRGETWWLRAEINGHKYRESLYTENVREARRLRDKRIEEIKRETFHGEETRSWQEAVTAWAEHEAGQLGELTFRRYLVSLAQCEAHLVGLTIGAVTGKVLRDIVQARREAGVSPSTIKRDLTAISRVLDFAAANEWREGNPSLDVRRLLRERRDPIVLPDEASINAVLAEATPAMSNLIVGARLTGCRQDELVNAKWSAFNTQAKTLEVIGKGNKRRVISLSDAARKFIAGLPRDGELIFPSSGGDAWVSPSSAFGRTRRDGKPAVRFRFHDLRHLFAVEALRGGMGIYRLSQHLGHTSVKTTEIYLSFLTPEQAENARRT